MLTDSDVGVQATAISALADLCLALGRNSFATRQLTGLHQSQDAGIRELVDFQLKRLAS